jgi:polo-like kinase 4
LRQYIKCKALTESEVSNIMKQVVEGIKYLHTHNILHRDMSLSNLLLTKDMQVVSVIT